MPIIRGSAITTRYVRLDMQAYVGQDEGVVEGGGGECDECREGQAERKGVVVCADSTYMGVARPPPCDGRVCRRWEAYCRRGPDDGASTLGNSCLSEN